MKNHKILSGTAAFCLLAFAGLSSTAHAVILTQSASQTVMTGSVSCNSGGRHTDNSYYRVFSLASFGEAAPFSITAASFGIEQARSQTGSQPIVVNIYDTTNLAGLGTPVATANLNVADQTLSILNFSISAMITSPGFVFEVFSPNGQAAGNSFFIGSNNAGQTAPSYIKAAACGVASPTNLASIGFPNMHLIMNVEGTSVPAPGALAFLGLGGLVASRRRRA